MRLAGELDERIGRALDILAGVTGRVIVTGMGKSGHIARKIAATFASTGTPAQFVHPGEASHGDLGMVTAADAVVALSNSGETFELADIVTIIDAATAQGLDAADYLRRNDAYQLFKPLGALIKTGPTHTNVCDLRVVLVDRPIA